MKKNSIFFIFYLLLYFLLVFPLMNHDRMTGPNPFNMFFVIFQTNYIFWVVVGSLWSHEQIEYKSNGYTFLNSLPIKNSELIASKFSVVFLAAVLFVGYHYFVFTTMSPPPGFMSQAMTYQIFIANISLILAGLLYLGIFRFGFLKFGKIALILWLSLLIIPIPIKQILLPRLGISPDDVIKAVTGFNWILVTLISLAVYYLLMKAAIRVKTANQT